MSGIFKQKALLNVVSKQLMLLDECVLDEEMMEVELFS